MAGIIGLAYLLQISSVARLGVRLSTVQRQIDQATYQHQQLSYQLGYYESFPVVRQVATEQLGMEPAESTLYLAVQWPADKELVVPASTENHQPSLARRTLDRLLGRGSASGDAGDPAP